jgi:cytoskeletal protein CcmA (bactofilin family)
MNEAPKRRLRDAFSGTPTFLGERTKFVGNLETSGPLVVCGHVQGDGHVDGSVNLAVGAHWEGGIHAAQAVIAGRVTGTIVIEEKLEIGQTAVIHGSVTARMLAIARGAVVDGDITITSGAPITRFEEKRKKEHEEE